ncbi:MAG: type II secretion system GspH family protein [Kiritimatiellaeota bacterium]|nr:type II secretion system GspH family protein [Kiritimatiellota bacterium]
MELLTVICIIGILASALIASVRSGFKTARQADCKNKLRQLGVAITIYRGEHDDQVPDWISNLYPEYIDDLATYVCYADEKKGSDAPVPPGYLQKISQMSGNFYSNTGAWDNERGSGQTRTLAITRGSYCYEFSAAPGAARWYSGEPLPDHEQGFTTIGQYKKIQMKYGDENNNRNGIQMPYPASKIPIVRCCHHWKDQFIWWPRDQNWAIAKMPIVINVTYAGNVYASGPWWESMGRNRRDD